MDWRTLLHPDGPLPRSVYWLRRAALGLVLVFVVALIVVIVGRHGGGSHPAATVTATRSSAPRTSAAPTSTSAATTSAAAGATDSPRAGASCTASALTVSVRATDKTVPRRTDVHIVATLATTGPACAAVGPLSVVVTSGSDRIWGSTDCASAGSTTTTLADHGTASATRTWNLVRSRPGCATVVGDRTADPGHYRMTATWAGVTSGSYDFTLE